MHPVAIDALLERTMPGDFVPHAGSPTWLVGLMAPESAMFGPMSRPSDSWSVVQLEQHPRVAIEVDHWREKADAVRRFHFAWKRAVLRFHGRPYDEVR